MAYSIIGNLSGLTDPGLAAAYSAGFASTAAPLGRFANVFEHMAGTYTIGVFTPAGGYAAASSEGAAIVHDAIEQEGTKAITVAEYVMGFALSATALRTLSPDVIPRQMAQLGAYPIRFFEEQIAALFNAAKTTTTTFDGVALGSTAHPTAGADQSNLVNSTLSHSTYNTAAVLLRNQANSRGTKMGGSPTALLAAPANEQLGRNIVGAPMPGVGSYAANDLSQQNVYAGTADLVVSADLSATGWHVFDEMQWQANGGVAIPVVMGPNPRVTERAEGTDQYKVDDRISCAFGIGQWRGLVVGNA